MQADIKKNKYAIIKNIRFEKWKQVKITTLLLAHSRPILMLSPKPSPKNVMLNSKLVSKKRIEHKKYPKVVRVSKKSVDILHLRVNLIVRKLFALAFALKKQLTKAIAKDKAI